MSGKKPVTAFKRAPKAKRTKSKTLVDILNNDNNEQKRAPYQLFSENAITTKRTVPQMPQDPNIVVVPLAGTRFYEQKKDFGDDYNDSDLNAESLKPTNKKKKNIKTGTDIKVTEEELLDVFDEDVNEEGQDDYGNGGENEEEGGFLELVGGDDDDIAIMGKKKNFKTLLRPEDQDPSKVIVSGVVFEIIPVENGVIISNESNNGKFEIVYYTNENYAIVGEYAFRHKNILIERGLKKAKIVVGDNKEQEVFAFLLPSYNLPVSDISMMKGLDYKLYEKTEKKTSAFEITLEGVKRKKEITVQNEHVKDILMGLGAEKRDFKVETLALEEIQAEVHDIELEYFNYKSFTRGAFDTLIPLDTGSKIALDRGDYFIQKLTVGAIVTFKVKTKTKKEIIDNNGNTKVVDIEKVEKKRGKIVEKTEKGVYVDVVGEKVFVGYSDNSLKLEKSKVVENPFNPNFNIGTRIRFESGKVQTYQGVLSNYFPQKNKIYVKCIDGRVRHFYISNISGLIGNYKNVKYNAQTKKDIITIEENPLNIVFPSSAMKRGKETSVKLFSTLVFDYYEETTKGIVIKFDKSSFTVASNFETFKISYDDIIARKVEILGNTMRDQDKIVNYSKFKEAIKISDLYGAQVNNQIRNIVLDLYYDLLLHPLNDDGNSQSQQHTEFLNQLDVVDFPRFFNDKFKKWVFENNYEKIKRELLNVNQYSKKSLLDFTSHFPELNKGPNLDYKKIQREIKRETFENLNINEHIIKKLEENKSLLEESKDTIFKYMKYVLEVDVSKLNALELHTHLIAKQKIMKAKIQLKIVALNGELQELNNLHKGKKFEDEKTELKSKIAQYEVASGLSLFEEYLLDHLEYLKESFKPFSFTNISEIFEKTSKYFYHSLGLKLKEITGMKLCFELSVVIKAYSRNNLVIRNIQFDPNLKSKVLSDETKLYRKIIEYTENFGAYTELYKTFGIQYKDVRDSLPVPSTPQKNMERLKPIKVSLENGAKSVKKNINKKSSNQESSKQSIEVHKLLNKIQPQSPEIQTEIGNEIKSEIIRNVDNVDEFIEEYLKKNSLSTHHQYYIIEIQNNFNLEPKDMIEKISKDNNPIYSFYTLKEDNNYYQYFKIYKVVHLDALKQMIIGKIAQGYPKRLSFKDVENIQRESVYNSQHIVHIPFINSQESGVPKVLKYFISQQLINDKEKMYKKGDDINSYNTWIKNTYLGDDRIVFGFYYFDNNQVYHLYKVYLHTSLDEFKIGNENEVDVAEYSKDAITNLYNSQKFILKGDGDIITPIKILQTTSFDLKREQKIQVAINLKIRPLVIKRLNELNAFNFQLFYTALVRNEPNAFEFLSKKEQQKISIPNVVFESAENVYEHHLNFHNIHLYLKERALPLYFFNLKSFMGKKIENVVDSNYIQTFLSSPSSTSPSVLDKIILYYFSTSPHSNYFDVCDSMLSSLYTIIYNKEENSCDYPDEIKIEALKVYNFFTDVENNIAELNTYTSFNILGNGVTDRDILEALISVTSTTQNYKLWESNLVVLTVDYFQKNKINNRPPVKNYALANDLSIIIEEYQSKINLNEIMQKLMKPKIMEKLRELETSEQLRQTFFDLELQNVSASYFKYLDQVEKINSERKDQDDKSLEYKSNSNEDLLSLNEYKKKTITLFEKIIFEKYGTNIKSYLNNVLVPYLFMGTNIKHLAKFFNSKTRFDNFDYSSLASLSKAKGDQVDIKLSYYLPELYIEGDKQLTTEQLQTRVQIGIQLLSVSLNNLTDIVIANYLSKTSYSKIYSINFVDISLLLEQQITTYSKLSGDFSKKFVDSDDKENDEKGKERDDISICYTPSSISSEKGIFTTHSIPEIKKQFASGNYINPFTGKQFSQEFINKINQHY
jgi:hypothetical protein